ncbi:hypothetical protein HOO54_05025 [Bacillus sp. WMMC1349]|uniref:SAR2788 family putative toxin n=1 Tax=Bacillus sp. WMMC1349 TaxID=2736254 RepID=UPI001556B13E|nr:SAR2788 family putative toxin [Bacillus sp. WMMC1349]NPC90766.1 hypothetical protein [Bacillus sp. WMMC1349]NPC91620.1 hypothetical protein [Bacillus sp. WMMC1349]
MKYFVSFLVAIFVFYSLGTDVTSASTTQLESTNEEVIDNEEINSETEEIFGETVDGNNVEINSEIDGDKATVETDIATDDLSVDGELELDLETGDMVVTAEAENESGELPQKEFEVQLHEVDGDDFTATLKDVETGEEFEVNTTQLQASWYPVIIIAIHVARYGIKYAMKKFGKTAVKKATKKYGKKATAKDLKKLKFRNADLFDEHYKKHKREYGNISKSKYLKKAQALAGTTGKHILTKKRKNGDILKYNTKTNDFLSMTKNDVIKTFFKPKRGKAYFKEQ